MSVIDFSTLSPLDCPLVEQPSDNTCVGDQVLLNAYNLAVIERALLNSVTPAGIPHWYAGGLDTIPKNYILCDGSYYETTTYPVLFSAIKYRHGKGALDTFRVPDLRGVSIVGSDLGSGNITDVALWQGRDVAGATKLGDNVGATNTYCENNDLEDCVTPRKEVLLLPIISTGEICL